MSTRCLIGIKENSKVRYIYCHNDGYPEGGVGETLLTNYGELNTRQLMNLGDISSLGTTPISLPLLWDIDFFRNYFNSNKYSSSYKIISQTFCCTYGGRGEDCPCHEVDFENYNFECQEDADFIYLLMNGTWYFKEYDDDDWRKVSSELNW